MGQRSNVHDWLAGFVVPDAPRGADALVLARALVDALDSPQRHAPAVHIVGTAGKGAAALWLTSRLVAADFAVATHMSPHVHDIRERFLVDGELPPWSEVESAVEEVDAAVAAVEARHERRPTFFAVTAALSWVLGRRHDVDVFVTEAGIGGRVDATAVLDRPDTLTVVTHVGLDHTDALGSTVEAIAAEKAAVFEGRRVAVLGPQSSVAATGAVRRVALAQSVELIEVDPVDGDWRAQADATVEAASEVLASLLGREISSVEVGETPGRMEECTVAERIVVLDGAHNEIKLRALVESMQGRSVSTVIAALGSGKDLERAAALLRAFAAPVVAMEFGGEVGPRSWPAVELARALTDAGAESVVASSVTDAVSRALSSSSEGDTILVTGSFLILSDVLGAFGDAARS